MEIVHKDNKYASGGDNHKIELDYDFMLFRQDWNGSERVYFNLNERKKIIKMVIDGKILIHGNYSILYTKNEELLEEAPQLGCFIINEK